MPRTSAAGLPGEYIGRGTEVRLNEKDDLIGFSGFMTRRSRVEVEQLRFAAVHGMFGTTCEGELTAPGRRERAFWTTDCARDIDLGRAD